MRDIKRIRPFCERLAAAWERFPDLRFGQFIFNVYSRHASGDPFFVEDDETIQMIEKFVDDYSAFGVK
jgi:hypothetical protein